MLQRCDRERVKKELQLGRPGAALAGCSRHCVPGPRIMIKRNSKRNAARHSDCSQLLQRRQKHKLTKKTGAQVRLNITKACIKFWKLFLYTRTLFLIYPGVSSTILRLYICKDIKGQEYLLADLASSAERARGTSTRSPPSRSSSSTPSASPSSSSCCSGPTGPC